MLVNGRWGRGKKESLFCKQFSEPLKKSTKAGRELAGKKEGSRGSEKEIRVDGRVKYIIKNILSYMCMKSIKEQIKRGKNL